MKDYIGRFTKEVVVYVVASTISGVIVGTCKGGYNAYKNFKEERKKKKEENFEEPVEKAKIAEIITD